MAESNNYKTQANQLFGSSKYSEAISTYEKAISACPNYLDYEQAVLRSNIAACHVQLGDWKAAVKSAAASLEALNRLDPKPGAAEELDTSGAAGEGSITRPACTQEDRDRIRVKALLRRARANSEIGGWSALQSAEDGWCPCSSCYSRTLTMQVDYKQLSDKSNLPKGDQKTVQRQIQTLPQRIKEAQDKEVGEMWGKLKEVYILLLVRLYFTLS